MSALLMGRVFYAPLPSHLKLCLLALADHADDDGGNVYPGQARLAEKVGAAVRTVRDQVHELERLGYLIPEGRHGQRGTLRYRIDVGHLDRQPTADRQPGAERQPTAERQKLPTGSPAHAIGSRPAVERTLDRQPTADKPSVTTKKKQPSGKSDGARKTRLPDLFPLTEDLRSYAVRKGCRDPERTYEAFTTYYRGSGKTQADWFATWRTWVLGAHGGPAWKACGCAPSPGARVTTMDAARSLAAKYVARGQV